jgi:hypothetical protein
MMILEVNRDGILDTFFVWALTLNPTVTALGLCVKRAVSVNMRAPKTHDELTSCVTGGIPNWGHQLQADLWRVE